MDENIVYFGGGCFWNAELVYSKVKGVIETEVGWCLFNDDQGQVEVVKVAYNPNETTIEDLIVPFWTTHSPGNNKHSDSQYVDENQEKIMKKALENYKQEKPTNTTISRFKAYKKAPEKDQKYYIRN